MGPPTLTREQSKTATDVALQGLKAVIFVPAGTLTVPSVLCHPTWAVVKLSRKGIDNEARVACIWWVGGRPRAEWVLPRLFLRRMCWLRRRLYARSTSKAWRLSMKRACVPLIAMWPSGLNACWMDSARG